MSDVPAIGDYDIYTASGSPGLRRASGFIFEEPLSKLSGIRGIRIYREMGDNDPVIGGFLHAIEVLCRSVEWRLEARDENDPAAAEQKDFVDSCREDMSHSWQHFVSEALSCIQYGWSYLETIYKIRRGPGEADGRFRSRHTDGKIGWRKLDRRAQQSLLRWEYDDEQSIRGLWQLPQDIYQQRFVPIEKSLLFRVKAPLNNPEGRSLLRNAYRPWYMKKRLEEIEAIGIARDLAGVPVAEVPVQYLAADAPAPQQAIVATMRNLVERIHRDEFEGIVFPASEYTDTDGVVKKSGFKLSLMTSGGPRQIQPDVAIKRYESRMAMTLMAEWMMLGVDNVGTQALASEKTDLFKVGLKAILDAICDPMNNFAIPRLMTLNGVPEPLWPTLVHGEVADVDLAAFAQALNLFVGQSIITPDDKLEAKVREIAGLPQADTDQKPRAKPVPLPSAAPAEQAPQAPEQPETPGEQS